MNDLTILYIKSLKKSFVRNFINIRGHLDDESFFILENIDFKIEKGKVSALIGGNGTGKTTTFNILSRFIDADDGTILFNPSGITDEDLRCLSSSANTFLKKEPFEIARLGIGRMFQDNHIFQNMTVLENMLVADDNDFGESPVRSFFSFKGLKEREQQRIEKAENILKDLFGMNNDFLTKKHEKARLLSYGQQRLLGLARLLMGNYSLLLLDEPTSGINPVFIERIKVIIKYFVEQKGLTVLLIEHNMNFVKEVADYCLFMSQGRIAKSGKPDEIIGNPEVRKILWGI